MIVQYLIAGKSVLFISQSNIAVDIVTKQIVQSENRRIQQLKKKNLLLRSGYPKMQPIEQWDDVLPYEIALGKEPTLAFELEMLRKERKTLLQQSKQGENVASQLKVNGLKLERVRSSVRDKVAELERGASFIATTVAKASVTNAIRARKFDAVVIDEASIMNVPSVFAERWPKTTGLWQETSINYSRSKGALLVKRSAGLDKVSLPVAELGTLS